MKLKQIRLSYKQQLVRAVKGSCLSAFIFSSMPTTLVKAEARLVLAPNGPAKFLAQIAPDESLSTSVKQQGENQLNINGGEREGNNLFHSFEEFSVPEGIEAVFKNETNIENIFTRVTGETASSIDGLLRTQGGANFFLVNPNGIVFGENAQLDVGGSFIATTADSIQFEDGTKFATSNAEEQPILTVSVPIGLQFEGNSGAITVNGSGSQISRNPDVAQFTPFYRGKDSNGLSVQPGKILALIGAELNVEGGNLSAESGQIELGSVSSGEVKLEYIHSGLSFGYEAISNFKDINLSENASADASGNGGGSIRVNAANIRLTDGSIFLIQNNGKISSGEINVNASEYLVLSGAASDLTTSSIASETLNEGSATKIELSAKHLLLQNGGNIISTTFSIGRGGNINVNASNSLQLFRTVDGFIERATSRIATPTYDVGDSGMISISTPLLKASNGSSIATGTALSTGNGGSIDIKADLIELDGLTEKDGVFTTILSSTFGTGNAGRLNIDTSILKLINGATVSTDSRNSGMAGNITINASERIEISNVDPNTLNSSAVSSSVTIEENEVFREALRLPSIPNGQAGNVTINAPSINVNSGGKVRVENQGTGNAGMLSINADFINLERAGSLTAFSASGIGGNIDLNTKNLQIDPASQITATAQNNGDGGNISINTTNLIAKKNSEVTANAFAGRGGNIDINAEGLFLFDSPENIFSASSELGIDGEIQIDTLEIDLQKELEQSELEFLTAEQAIANSCLARSSQQGSFTINDNGGLPKNPNSNYSDADFSLTGVSRLTTTNQPSEISENSQQQNHSAHSAIPAQKMIETESGRIFLVAAPQKAESLYCKTKAVLKDTASHKSRRD